jgi:hypothetical protein
MITTNIMGGLGNQMFQIFNAISYTLDNSCQFVFPDEKVLYAGENTTLRHAYWDTLFYTLQSFLKNEKDIKYDIKIYEKCDSSYTRLPAINELINYVNEKNNTFFTCIDIHFTGYFQSYKYFQHNYDKIIKFLDFNKIKREVLDCVSSENDIEYLLENSISLHFRIGDFVKYTNSHIILSDQYYADAIKTIIDKLRDSDNNTEFDSKQYNIIYFCEQEDINTVCKRIENIQKLLGESMINNPGKIYNCVFIKSPSILTDWQEILFMSMCKHNIIANSSFSWWGAYLNDNPNKIVCYSSVYYSKNYSKKTDDLFPENWFKITDNYAY